MDSNSYRWLVTSYLQPSSKKWTRAQITQKATRIERAFQAYSASLKKVKTLSIKLGSCDEEYLRLMLVHPNCLQEQSRSGTNYVDPELLVYYVTGYYL